MVGQYTTHTHKNKSSRVIIGMSMEVIVTIISELV